MFGATIVEKLATTCPHFIWRGVSKYEYDIMPRVGYRLLELKDAKRNMFASYEKTIFENFRSKARLHHETNSLSEFEWLALAQHYGVPTRLLDWTENPFIGLYFAIMSSPFSGKLVGSKAELSFSSDAALWILDPIAWNRHALRLQRFDRGILTPSDEALQSYKPLTRFPDMNIHPVAIYGAHNSPRIVAQRGAFMIFGQSTQGMEDAYEQETFPTTSLQKVILVRDVLPAMRASILKNGITESVVFPDLEGLSREIKRDFEFEY